MDCSWDFSGKTCIVTGAANGIGAQLSALMANAGAAVVMVDNDKIALPKSVAACADIAAVTPLPILADVSNKAEVKRMLSEILEHHETVDFMVTCAGILYRTKFVDIELEEWDEVMDTNIRGMFLCNQMVVVEMLKQGAGRIVNVASVAGR